MRQTRTNRRCFAKLIFPPHFSVNQPYIAIPVLTAFLKERGIPVSQEDLNLTSFHYFMQPEYLHRCTEKVESRLRDYESKSFLPHESQRHYESICKALLSATMVIDNIDKALRFFDSPDGFLDFDEYSLNERIIQQAMQLVSAAHYPTTLSLIDFIMHHSSGSSREIMTAVEDDKTNPYVTFLHEYVTEKLKAEKPTLMGISITALSQVIPGLTLARIIKRELPDSKIVLGGVIPTHLSDKIKVTPDLFNLFDYIIKHEGETPLFRLCQSIMGEIPLDEVPNLICLRSGVVCDSSLQTQENVDMLPTPDFNELPLEQYLSPLPVFSIELARGCYWRKCVFCNQYSTRGKVFRLRNLQRILGDIKQLQRLHNANLYNFANEGISAKHLCDVAETILANQLDIRWYAGARLKKDFTAEVCGLLRQSGCQRLNFGLESGSQRVLDIMKKGIELKDVPQILRNCTSAGIDVTLYLMLGFPTETTEEIRTTEEFVLSNLSNLNRETFTFYISVFQAMIGSPIINQLPKFGYKIVSDSSYYDLEYMPEFQPRKSSISAFSREKLEEISMQMAKDIYAHLPPQSAPDDITHSICYNFLSETYPQRASTGLKAAEMKINYELLLNNQSVLQKREWVALRQFKFLQNQKRKKIQKGILRSHYVIAYNLLTGKYYLLNREAGDYLTFLQLPRKTSELVEERRAHLNVDPELKQFLIFSLEEKLICIRDEHVGEPEKSR